jgi:hypothetical protein
MILVVLQAATVDRREHKKVVRNYINFGVKKSYVTHYHTESKGPTLILTGELKFMVQQYSAETKMKAACTF